MNDFFLFAIFPYLSMGIFFLVTIQRYRQRTFTYSSLSSQFLENKHHFWGSVPFHYGILFVLAGHVGAFLVPKTILSWNSAPLRMFLLEVTGLAFALLALVGLLNIVIRRWNNLRTRTVTTWSDWGVYLLLAIQVLSGISIAVFNGWGSSWFAASAAPWLWSLVRLNPDVSFVAPLPFMVKLHIINAFLLIGFFPFTRLVHVLVLPNPYLWRKTQVVLWNWNRFRIRKPQ
ncbi:MAG: respiratory nitrate reductase subunit gamma [Planctomycetota bacterium]